MNKIKNRKFSRTSVLRAFTLVEILVVLLVVGIIMALVIPAIQASRESARRIQCVSNLSQLGRAFHSYHSSVGSLPQYVNARKGFSAITMILPQLEMVPLYNSVNFTRRVFDPENHTCSESQLSGLLCPSDYGRGRSSSWTNYACNVGYGYQIDRGFNGMFVKGPAKPVSLDAVSDGTSHTSLMAEWSIGTGSKSTSEWNSDVFSNRESFIKANQFDLFLNECNSINQINYKGKIYHKKGNIWMQVSNGNSCYNHNNMNSCLNGGLYVEGAWSAGSRHKHGANVLFADGHVQFVNDSITLPTWRALGTRDRGETEATQAF